MPYGRRTACLGTRRGPFGPGSGAGSSGFRRAVRSADTRSVPKTHRQSRPTSAWCRSPRARTMPAGPRRRRRRHRPGRRGGACSSPWRRAGRRRHQARRRRFNAGRPSGSPRRSTTTAGSDLPGPGGQRASPSSCSTSATTPTRAGSPSGAFDPDDEAPRCDRPPAKVEVRRADESATSRSTARACPVPGDRGGRRDLRRRQRGPPPPTTTVARAAPTRLAPRTRGQASGAPSSDLVGAGAGRSSTTSQASGTL